MPRTKRRIRGVLHLDVEVHALAGEARSRFGRTAAYASCPRTSLTRLTGDVDERPTEPPLVVAAVEAVAAVAVDVTDHRRYVVGNAPQPLLAFLRLGLRVAQIGDVLHETIEADDLAALDPGRVSAPPARCICGRCAPRSRWKRARLPLRTRFDVRRRLRVRVGRQQLARPCGRPVAPARVRTSARSAR